MVPSGRAARRAAALAGGFGLHVITACVSVFVAVVVIVEEEKDRGGGGIIVIVVGLGIIPNTVPPPPLITLPPTDASPCP